MVLMDFRVVLNGFDAVLLDPEGPFVVGIYSTTPAQTFSTLAEDSKVVF